MSEPNVPEKEAATGDYNNPYFKTEKKKSSFWSTQTTEDDKGQASRKDEDYFSDMEENEEDTVKPIIFNSFRYKYTKSIVNCK